MCTQNAYTYVYPDGYREVKYGDIVPCERALRGRPFCSNPAVFEYPAQPVSYEATAPYVNQLPPTPQYSPLPSTPVYRSGDDSAGSHTSSNSKKKRSSGIYINGHKVLDLNRRESRRDRIVVVDSPPTPQTPPQQTWSVPDSPNSYGESSRRRPLVVNKDRNTVQIEVVGNERPSRSHSRHTSSSSHHSSDDEAKRRRREHKHEEEEMRKQRYLSRIAKANREIGHRPAVPKAPALKRASTYKRPAVEVLYDPEVELAKEARREERARQKEEDEQLKRLKDRMSRASVSPGGRRHRVMYDDGTYR